MITATQLQTLTEKLARGSGSSSGQVTLKVPREHKLQKFTGVTDDYLFEDWILYAKRAISSQSKKDAGYFFLYHLEGAAKEELQLQPDMEKNTPEAVFQLLQSSFEECNSLQQSPSPSGCSPFAYAGRYLRLKCIDNMGQPGAQSMPVKHPPFVGTNQYIHKIQCGSTK